MYLKSVELSGFKSFAKKEKLEFTSAISGIVGPNGSGKSNIAEGFRFVLGEQSMTSMRGKRGEDLIFNGSESSSRANRAAVKVSFDNASRLFDIDFDEVSIERAVLRDGVNQYSINGSTVRLKDVVELLANANIGATGHHIISQGEADRILNASLKERREIIEDALGLKVYQYKKNESEKKLTKTEENIAQVQSLRKEIAPHLKFLERQVKKLEKALSMKDELETLYGEYLKRESEYITYHTKRIAGEKEPLLTERRKLQEELTNAKAILEKSNEGDEKTKEIVSLEEQIAEVRRKKDSLSRDVGRVEGQIQFEERRLKREEEKAEKTGDSLIKLSEVETLTESISKSIEEVDEHSDASSILQALESVRDRLLSFIREKKEGKSEIMGSFSEEEFTALKDEKKELDARFVEVEESESALNIQYERMRKEIESSKDESREAEREVFRIMQEQNGIEAQLSSLGADEERIRRDDEELKRELTEAGVLVGQKIAQ
jgi:chromosome segregation protein